MTEMKSSARHGQGRGCVITRRACFSASHRYWLPELSADDNAARFGPCALAPGHGHNYELIVSMAGDNVLWGAERIRGELLKLSIRVSKRDPVGRYDRTRCQRRRKPR